MKPGGLDTSAAYKQRHDLGLAETDAAKPADRTCAAISADLAAARASGRLKEAVALYAEAQTAKAGCESKALFCLGRSVALAHVEAAYAAAGHGDTTAATRLFTAGRPFGEPWPLLVGLGDAEAAAARSTHDPGRWNAASLDDQKAIAALDEPPLCPDEPPPPEPQAYDQILRKMTLATLLARPAALFQTKCAPCGLAMLAHGPISSDDPRPLPITFEPDSASLTPEGLATAKALADCARQGHWTAVAVSAHTDERGSPEINQVMSRQRLETLQHLLEAGGYRGAFTGDPKGKAEPLIIEDAGQLTRAEIQRANRRIELRSIASPVSLSCVRSEDKAP